MDGYLGWRPGVGRSWVHPARGVVGAGAAPVVAAAVVIAASTASGGLWLPAPASGSVAAARRGRWAGGCTAGAGARATSGRGGCCATWELRESPLQQPLPFGVGLGNGVLFGCVFTLFRRLIPALWNRIILIYLIIGTGSGSEVSVYWFSGPDLQRVQLSSKELGDLTSFFFFFLKLWRVHLVVLSLLDPASGSWSWALKNLFLQQK